MADTCLNKVECRVKQNQSIDQKVIDKLAMERLVYTIVLRIKSQSD
jgi:hypothetical protein